MTYTDYTVDLETMGTNATSAVVSIGAVAFNRNAPEFDPERTIGFYRNIELQSCLDLGLTIDGSTVMWWLEQSQDARISLLKPTPLDVQAAFIDYKHWVRDGLGSDIPCWTHATFDAPIIGNVFRTIQHPQPTHYRKQRDIRTLNDLNGYFKVTREGVHHNALADALFQAEYIWALLNGKGVRKE
jgi:DNA polymerase III epsilon subunit-like protein